MLRFTAAVGSVLVLLLPAVAFATVENERQACSIHTTSAPGPDAPSEDSVSCADDPSVTCPEGSSGTADSETTAGQRGDSLEGEASTPFPATHTCTARVTCQSGATVTCTGSSYCREYPGCWVQCDGETVECPPPLGGGLPCPYPP